MKPRLTVVIPVYNGMPFLPETVKSVLNQTFQDFKLIIINDGSTDQSADFLDSLTDSRIEIKHQKNKGLCNSLNQVIAEADTELIARLDQDDVALPSRFYEQLTFLDSHPDYDCVLSNISRISENGKEFGFYTISCQEEISDYDSSIYGCIVHSTICLKKDTFIALGGYRQSVYPVDDYDLLLRLEETAKVAVINKPLVKYRIHGKAGTFKTFHDMALKSRYVLAIASQRRNGEIEISLDDFEKTIDKVSFHEKIRREMNDRGKLMFRQAGLAIGENRYAVGALKLILALILSPQFSFGRLISLRKKKGYQLKAGKAESSIK
jgi:glycosyltransferase involved in cell wall biosynthesis